MAASTGPPHLPIPYFSAPHGLRCVAGVALAIIGCASGEGSDGTARAATGGADPSAEGGDPSEGGARDPSGSVSEHCEGGLSSGCTGGEGAGTPCTSCEMSPASAQGPIKEYFARFTMPVEREGCTLLHRPHSTRRWGVFYPGRCAGCGIPNRINSAAFGNTLVASWVGSADYADSEEANQRRFGHLSTFTFTEEDGFTKVSDFVYDECDFDMGSVAVSPDGSVIGALCLSDRDDSDAQNNVFLYEWTGGEITQTPDKRTQLSGAAGGWNHGHWDISLNAELTHYYVSLKTVSKDGAHQGMTRYALNRQTQETEPARESCGGGHPNSNRITYNQHDDSWSVFCRMDDRVIRWAQLDDSDFKGSVETIGSYVVTNRTDGPGGLHNGISLGSDGWLVAATGPFDLFVGYEDSSKGQLKERLADQQIGLRKLPPNMADFQEDPAAYPWTWIGQDVPAHRSGKAAPGRNGAAPQLGARRRR